MRTSRWIWAIWVIVFLSYIVPYTVLRNIHAWYGSFLLWTATGLLVIVFNALITRNFINNSSKV